jgi:hypothetical protein
MTSPLPPALKIIALATFSASLSKAEFRSLTNGLPPGPMSALGGRAAPKEEGRV